MAIPNRRRGAANNQPTIPDDTYICQKCDLEMVKKATSFSYMGRTFNTDLYRCPKCGQVMIPEELVKGRMKEVETIMEDK